MADHEKLTDLANRVSGDWDSAMDRFFSEVDRKREGLGLTDEQVYQALDIGYGDVVADAWEEWAS